MSNAYVKNQLMLQKSHMELQVAKLAAQVLRKENDLMQKEQDSGVAAMLNVARQLPPWLSPGNIGSINEVIWPFFFPTPVVRVPVNNQATTSFSVTRGAGFIATGYVKTVFQRTEPVPGEVRYEYFDPNDTSGLGATPGLSFSWRDAQSSRNFVDVTINLDHVGNPRFPTALPSPQYFYPSATTEILFTNEGAQDYWVSLTFYGIRVRADGQFAQLSTVVDG